MSGEAHLAKIVSSKINTMPQADIIARIYPNMLEISSNIVPSRLEPIRHANELARINVMRYRAILMSVGTINNIIIMIRITPMLERRYSMPAPAVLNDSPILPPISGII